MAITVAYELDAVTVGTTELSIVSGTTTLQTTVETGVYQLWIARNTAMVAGDQFRVRIYEKVELTGGTKEVVADYVFRDVQVQNLVYPMLILMHGWDMTLMKVVGTDRAFDANIRRVN